MSEIKWIRNIVGAVVRFTDMLARLTQLWPLIKPISDFIDSFLDGLFPMTDKMAAYIGYLGTALQVVLTVVAIVVRLFLVWDRPLVR